MGWKDIFSKRRNEGRLIVPQRASRSARDVLDHSAAAAFEALRRQAPDWQSLHPGFVSGYLVGHTAQASAASERQDCEDAVQRLLAPLTGRNLEPPDAGALLLGHHEAQCGTQRLLALALDCAAGRASPDAVITACDTAADRLQTHDPQRNFRFTAEERSILRTALASLAVTREEAS